jgi:hypothetical protein
VPPKLPRARAAALIESVADAAAVGSVTPDRAISGADNERREACAAQASEMESSCVERERCRRSCGGERHTRQGDQPCGHRAASGCAAQASKIERSSLIESVADAAAVSSVTPDRATSGAVTEQRAACPAQASESEISSVDLECCRRSCEGERHTRQGNQRCGH